MSILSDVIIAAGLFAARPAFGSEGRLYYATDVAILYRDTGIAWEQYAGTGGVTISDYYGTNLIKNSPGQIPQDGLEPQWWDEGDANATLTDEDTVGEGIPDIHERCFKCITIANDKYGLQTFTLADEQLLDAGVTVVSFGCWVYCATGAKASIGIYGTNLTLQESVQAGANTWTWLEVNNITLNAGDATIEVRLIIDTDTAWFTMPMFSVGTAAQPWTQRQLRFIPLTAHFAVLDLNPTGDVAQTTNDITANSDPLAVIAEFWNSVFEPNGVVGSYLAIYHGTQAGSASAIPTTQALNFNFRGTAMAQLTDSQIYEYSVDEVDADNDMVVQNLLHSYWMWA